MNFFGLSSKRRRGGAPFSWTARTSSYSGTIIRAVNTDTSGTYISIGDGGKLATSTNAGVTWTQRTSSFSGSNVSDIAYDAGNSLWIAGGAAGKIATAAAADITSWTQRTSNFGGDAVFGVGCDGAGNSVAVGWNNKVSDSTNGTTWTARTGTFSSFGSKVNYGSDGNWVAAGADNDDISTSPNRVNWTDEANLLTATYVRDSWYNGSLWVVTAYSGQLASAVDPTGTWTNRTSGLGGTDNIHCVGYGNGWWLVGADDGNIAYSTDGINWTASTITAFTTGNDEIYGLTYDTTDDIWVAVGSSGICATSPGS